MSPEGALLEVDGLSVSSPTVRGRVRAVQSVSFSMGRGEVLGLVGESGSGKSTVAHAIAPGLPRSAGHAGTVLFRDEDVFAMDAPELRNTAGKACRWSCKER